MFTGIIESLGRIIEIERIENNLCLWISCDFVSELKIDQSVAHNGICLTVDHMHKDRYRVTAIAETIARTAIEDYQIGDLINLERCLLLSQRIDGHIVQGHIDGIGIISKIEELSGSWECTVQYDSQYAELIIEKGSIAIDGISLTCHSLIENSFKVSIIPYTYEHTIVKDWKLSRRVNLEFDILGKYLQRRAHVNS